jgi:hypothetical protein
VGKGKKAARAKAGTGEKRGSATVARLPKKKCCESRTKCGRCPLRMLKEGTLPEGYTVHRRRLVKTGAPGAGSPRKKDRAA